MAQALTYGPRGRVSHSAGSLVARLGAALADRRRYRQTVGELSRLSDRDLSDLGVHRASIRDVAWESVYGA